MPAITMLTYVIACQSKSHQKYTFLVVTGFAFHSNFEKVSKDAITSPSNTTVSLGSPSIQTFDYLAVASVGL